jgi:hypothetical protein
MMEIQEFISIDNIGGYSSVLGDGVNYKLDMCQNCFVKLLGDYIR